MITGSRDEFGMLGTDWKYDLDLSGLISLCDALPTLKNPIELDLSNCGLSVNGVIPVALAIKAGGALTSIVLDENELSGTKIKYKGSLVEEIQHLDADLSGFTDFCSSLKSSTIVSLSLRKCYLGPQAVDLLADAIRFKAALTSVNCLHNPLGQAVQILIKVFEETPRLRTLCGFEEGVEQIDWSKSGKGPADIALLAADLKAGRAGGAVASMTLDDNKTIGATGADSLMESICTTRNTQIVKIKHDVGAL
jgi:hypothetical protein